MALSTKDARRGSLSSNLRAWCETAPPDARRTVLVELATTADPNEICARLRDIGAEIVSEGAAVTVAVLSGADVEAAASVPGIVRMQLPQRLDPKTPED